MADQVGVVEDAIWPLPKFKFDVQFAVNKWQMSFSEVSGLDAEAQSIKYRHGNSKNNWSLNMPGLQQFSNVTLKRGVFVGDNKFFEWFSQIKANTIQKGRETVIISLLNEKDKPTMVWTLHGAWPSKITSTDMKSDGNDAAIDTLVLTFEYLEVNNKNNP